MAKETGLICTGESVRAFLDNRKSQTRRVCKKQPIDKPVQHHLEGADFSLWRFDFKNEVGDTFYDTIRCPYGQVGDKVFVQEAYQIIPPVRKGREILGHYLADGAVFDVVLTPKEWDKFTVRKKPYAKTSGRFMYKSLARIWREITGIRTERIQQMCHTDWVADFCPKPYEIEKALQTSVGDNNMKKMAKEFWDSINAKRGYSWDKNPWNWVLEVKG